MSPIRFLATIMLMFGFALSGCSKSTGNDTPPNIELIADTGVTANVTEQSDGKWRVDYRFAEPQVAMIFARSNGDYRRQIWTPIDTAPALERIGEFDALIFAGPVTTTSYLIEPHSEPIPRDYNPFLGFSDGTMAMFTGQFDLLPVTDRSGIEVLEGSLQNWNGDQPKMGTRIISDKPMIFEGKAYQREVASTSFGGGTYVYVGDTEMQEGASYIGVIDAALPAHIRETFDDDLASVFTHFEARWGFSLQQKATVYFAFRGYQGQGFLNHGSVVGNNLMVLETSGEALKQPSLRLRRRNLWFFAHEGTHMFQNASEYRRSEPQHAWLSEGGANAMAYEAMTAMGVADADFILETYRQEIADCAPALEEKALIETYGPAQYSCGNLISTLADAAIPDHTLYDIWNEMIERTQQAGLKGYSSELFFEALEARGAQPAAVSTLQALVYEQHVDGREAIYAAIQASGVVYEMSDDGVLTKFQLPG